MIQRILLVGFLSLLLCNEAFTQERNVSGSRTLNPAPYRDYEFPDWAGNLYRFELISVGVFPVSYFAVNTLYSFGRYLVLSIIGSEDAAGYNPFLSNGGTPNTRDEDIGIILTSAAISLVLGVVDYLLGLEEQKKAEGNAE